MLNYKRVFLAIFFLVLLIGGGLFFFWTKRADTEKTVVLKYGELDISGDFEALAVRNEKVIYANSSGAATYKVNDGDLIEKGDVVLEIELDEGVGSEVERKDRAADLAITARMLKEELKELRQSILMDMEYGRYEEAANKKREFRSKRELLDKIGNAGSVEESARETYLSKNRVSVYSSVRGLLSFSVDGMETAASLSNIYSLDFSKLGFAPQRMNVAKAAVIRGEQLYKIMDESSVYIAIRIPLNSRPETYVGAEGYLVKISGKEIEGVLHDSFTQGDSTVCVIRLNESFPTFFTTRMLSCVVSLKGYKGLMIPATALVEKGGVSGVYRVSVEGFAEFVPVKVLKNEAGNAIIQNGRFYDPRGDLVQTVEIGQRVVRIAANFKEGEPVD